jgi:hypothetical protein
VAAILVVVVEPLIGLLLTLLFRRAPGAVPAAAGAALAVVPLVSPFSIPHGPTTLVSLLISLLIGTGLERRVTLLFLAAIVVVARNHRSFPCLP